MIFLMDLQMMLLDVIYFILRNSLRVILPPCTKPIDGELVLITGSGSGLGRLFALEFTKQGAEVVLWDINSNSNEQTAKLVHEMGGKGVHLRSGLNQPGRCVPQRRAYEKGPWPGRYNTSEQCWSGGWEAHPRLS